MPTLFSRIPTTAATLALGLALWTVPAAAQYADLAEISNRLNRLEADLQTMQRQVARGGGGGAVAPTQAADFEIRLSQLERTVQETVGKYEEAVFGVSQVRQRLEKLSSDLDFRLSQLESRGSAETAPPARTSSPTPSPAPTPTAAAKPPAAPPAATNTAAARPADKPAPTPTGSGLAAGSTTIEAQYDEAFGLLRHADYDQAEHALSRFVSQHHDSPLAANAQYWLGETYYVRGKYSEAALAFGEGVQKYPKSPKAPDNLLKLGMALGQLKQNDSACKVFAQLMAQSPPAAASLLRRAKDERGKLACQ